MAKLKDSRVYGNLDIDSVLTVSSDTTINGNLTVTGNTIYSYVDTMKITDPILEMGGAESGALSGDDNKDRGSLLHYYDGAVVDAFMGWDNSASEFALGSNVSVTNEVVTFNTYGNLRAGTFFGNGSGLTNIPGGNVDGTVGYANMSSYAGIVTGATQSNITSVGTLVDLDVDGNITAGGTLAVTGDTTLTGDVEMSGNATIDGDLTVGGTIYANISGSLTAPGTNTQVLFNDAGGVNAVAGFTFNKSTQSLTLAGNLTGNLITGTTFSGNGAGLSSITGANVTGYVPDADHATIANIANVAYSVDGGNVSGEVSVANTVSNPEQGNITSVGTLTALTVSGNISGQDNLSISNNATVGGNIAVTGNVSGLNGSFSGTLQATGNANVGNLGTAAVVATANVDAANFNTAGTANIGNLKISGKTEGNLIPSANVTYDLGNLTHRWNDLYLSGDTIYLGDQTLESNATALFTSADIGAGNLRASNNTFSGNVYANSGLVKGSGLEGTLTANSNAQPNITSVGTLIDLDVTGNIAAGGLLTDNLYYANGVAWDLQQAAGDTGQLQFNTGDNFDASANLTYSATGAGTLTAAGNIAAAKLSSTADTTVGANLTVATNATVTGDISGAKITVTGDANSGNVYTTNVTATDTVTAVEVVTTDVTATDGDISINAAGTNANVVLAPTGTGTVDVSSKRITSVGTPDAVSDAATKGYVDSVAQGLSVKTSAHVATTTALPAYTYDNGTDGVGATLTADSNGVLSNIDNHGFSVGDRILVKDEVGANKPYNGVYTVTNLGSVSAPWVLTRAADVDKVEDFKGAFIFVADGTDNKNTGWAFSIAYESYSTVGTDDAAFTQFSGAGTYSADSGLELNGTVFSAVVDDATIEVGAGNALRVKDGLTLVTPNIGAATGTSLDLSGDVDVGGDLAVTGNVDANNFNGTFYGSFVGTVDATVGAAGANTEIQFNDAGNIGANSSFTFNKTTSTLSVGNVSATGNVSAANVTATNISGTTLTGTLQTAAQTNITSVGSLTSLDVTGDTTVGGNVTADFFIGNGSALASLTGSNVVGDVSGANHANIADVANLVYGEDVSGDVSGANHANIADVAYSVDAGNIQGQVANALVAGTVYTAAQPAITSVGTLTDLTVSGNVSTGGILTDNYYYANGAVVDFQTAAGNAGEIQFKSTSGNDLNASANFKFNSSTNVLTVTGNVSVSDTLTAVGVSATTLTGTLTTAAQPNITSVGEMTGLTVRGVSDFGSNANVKITGGTSGQYLQTDGLGALSWSTINTSLLSNGTSNVSVASNGNITLNVASSEIVKVSGVGANITGVLDVSGNVNAANVNAGLFVADADVDSTSSITGTVKVTGGIGATGNIYTGQSVGFANNNGGTSSAAYIQYNSGANSLDFIFN